MTTKSERSINVLVIDDDAIGRTLLCETLREHYSELTEVTTPIGASRIVSQERIDVVVLDVEMPNLSGDKLAKLFRTNPRLAHVGVVLVSGTGDDQLALLGLECQADATVTKAKVRADLVKAVQVAWEKSQRRRGRSTQ
ncbi:MAG TPA: response regulator [Polyangiaceae bacterium]|nr:response regulator [Polyangiaceae bacterium]